MQTDSVNERCVVESQLPFSAVEDVSSIVVDISGVDTEVVVASVVVVASRDVVVVGFVVDVDVLVDAAVVDSDIVVSGDVVRMVDVEPSVVASEDVAAVDCAVVAFATSVYIKKQMKIFELFWPLINNGTNFQAKLS